MNPIILVSSRADGMADNGECKFVKPSRLMTPGLSGVLVKDTIALMPSLFAASSSSTFSGLPHPASFEGSIQLKLRGRAPV